MGRQQTINTQFNDNNHSSIKKVSRHRTEKVRQTVSSSTMPTIKQNPSENLDDETKLAKRHLTKEMWQLVSIAVKRMADELVSISNNQQITARLLNSELSQVSNSPNNQQTTQTETTNLQQSTSTLPTGQQTIITANTGAGDVLSVSENSIPLTEPIKKRTLPMEILDLPLTIKKKGSSNNSTRRAIKSKEKNKVPRTKTNKRNKAQTSSNNHKKLK